MWFGFLKQQFQHNNMRQHTYWFTLRPSLPGAARNTWFTLETNRFMSSIYFQSLICVYVFTDNKHGESCFTQNPLLNITIIAIVTTNMLRIIFQLFLLPIDTTQMFFDATPQMYFPATSDLFVVVQTLYCQVQTRHSNSKH